MHHHSWGLYLSLILCHLHRRISSIFFYFPLDIVFSDIFLQWVSITFIDQGIKGPPIELPKRKKEKYYVPSESTFTELSADRTGWLGTQGQHVAAQHWNPKPVLWSCTAWGQPGSTTGHMLEVGQNDLTLARTPARWRQEFPLKGWF